MKDNPGREDTAAAILANRIRNSDRPALPKKRNEICRVNCSGLVDIGLYEVRGLVVAGALAFLFSRVSCGAYWYPINLKSTKAGD